MKTVHVSQYCWNLDPDKFIEKLHSTVLFKTLEKFVKIRSL